jgi:hypothetical protein
LQISSERCDHLQNEKSLDLPLGSRQRRKFTRDPAQRPSAAGGQGMSENGADRPDGADSQPKRTSHVMAVADTTPRVLAPNHLADLRKSGLTDETVALAGLYSEGKSKPIADILGWRWTNGGALVFPFVDYDSRKQVMSRIKPDSPRLRPPKNKPIKYEQAPGTGAIPYFGPRTILQQRLDNKALPLYWTEGEKKTLLLDQLGLAAFGLTGCHNFNDAQKYRDGDGLTWSKHLRKYAERFIKGRRHVIVYDSDAFENENVMLAMQRLAGLLLHDGAESVRYVRIPGDPSDKDRHIGIDDFFADSGEEATRALIETTAVIAPGESIQPIPPQDPLAKLSALQWLRAAKLPGDLRLPPRFEVRRDRSLWCEPTADKSADGEIKEVMRSVIVPTALLQSMTEEDGEQRIEITYYSRDDWRSAIIDRRALRDARRALAELPADCAISSNNASLVVAWFDEYMRHNEHRLELRRFVGECGWHDTADGQSVFVLDKPVSHKETRTRIEADDSGDRSRILQALRPRGSLEAHTSALNHAFEADKVAAITILASLAAPLLRPLNAPNFGVHLSGDSSRGKTTKLVVASSVYGDPRNDHWLGSWNASATAIELRASTLCDLPLCFDEVGAGDRFAIDRTIYMLINGSGKSRADRAITLRKTPVWRTVVLSTGEHELASQTANTGAQVRIIQFRVSGFGTFGAAEVDSLREACERNSGQVGRKWIETITSIDDWNPYLEIFKAAKEQFRSKEDKGNNLMQRQAVYYALLALAEHIASQSIGIGKKGGQTVRELFTSPGERREIKTASTRAIELVSESIASEPDTYPALEYNPSGGLVSRAKASVRVVRGVRYRSHVYLLPDLLKERLEASGLSYAEVVASWKEAGLTDCDEGRTVKRVRWDAKRLFVVAVKYDALGLETDETAQKSIGETEDNDYAK